MSSTGPAPQENTHDARNPALAAALSARAPANIIFVSRLPSALTWPTSPVTMRRLVIEVDGDTHGTDAGVARDIERDAFLVSQGYRVLHFTNDDVMHNGEGVYDIITRVLTTAEEQASNAR